LGGGLGGKGRKGHCLGAFLKQGKGFQEFIKFSRSLLYSFFEFDI
jgi:hypothetical protein